MSSQIAYSIKIRVRVQFILQFTELTGEGQDTVPVVPHEFIAV